MDLNPKNPRLERLDREIIYYTNKQRDELAAWELYKGKNCIPKNIHLVSLDTISSFIQNFNYPEKIVNEYFS